MGEFGSVGWEIFEKFLLTQGCVLHRTKGDHRIYRKQGLTRPLVVPQYNPLPPFIILNNLRTLGAEKDIFIKFLKK